MEGNQKLILVVEDQAINRQIIKRILVGEYRIIEASNGQEGLNMLEKYPDITAVLLDIVMPVMDGYGFLNAIKGSKYADLPIIVMTGEHDPLSEKKALDCGAWDFVTKPFQVSIILSRLKNAIARRQASLYEKMQYISDHDSLTGMYNRRKMFAEVQQMLSEHPEEKFVFIRLDIDHFKLYNSAFGEKEGDRLLKYFASMLIENSKPEIHTICGKMDADIFCVCETYDKALLDRQVAGIRDNLLKYKRDYLLELSCGAYIINEQGLSVEDMYIRASLAAQKCKHQYRVSLAYYDEQEGKRSNQEIEIINEMQTALDEKQFVLYFQPKYKLSNDTAFGAEALVRWRHPKKGLISPGVFIPVFEKNGFIAKLDYYVWEETCIFLRKWMDLGYDPFPVSVNISRVSMYNPQICQVFVDLIKKYNLPSQLLHLEITESAYMSNPELMKSTIRKMHQNGFVIMMDDFGSGYSSLNTLKDIDVDILKFDMKFLPINEEEMAKGEIILVSTIRMANWLGMSVVVEGVETSRQRDFLEGIGCDYVQGYFYAKPMPDADYEADYVNPSGDKRQLHFQRDMLLRVQAQEENSNANKDTILIVDDDEMNRELLKIYLEDKFNICQCDNVEDAITFLHHDNRVRLILIDNYMTGMTGLDFLEYSRYIPSLAVIPKIMITASEQPDDQIKAFQRGAYDYINKPLIKEVVLPRVEHALEMRQQLKKVETIGEEYKSLAERDEMTDLLNKTTCKKLCSRMMENAPDDLRAMLIIDIDNFKEINDQFGHLTGDNTIRGIANTLKSLFRKTDLVSRYGGDEFVVIMNELSSYDACKNKAADVVKTVHFACMEKLHLSVSVSVGVSYAKKDDIFDSLFAKADQALYAAKNGGRNRYSIYGENVPPIANDQKPIVLICGEDPQVYPAIALAYGDSCAFANITSMEQLKSCFTTYKERISVVCMDVQKREMPDSDAFYQYIVDQGGGVTIPIIAICPDGDIAHLRSALSLNIADVITLPPQIDTIRRRLSRNLLLAQEARRKKE